MHNHLLVPPTLWLVVGLALIVGLAVAMPAAAVSLRIPSTKVMFPNGLTVVVAERHKLPLTTISIRIKAGSAHDPDDRAGVADLTARLLDKGTQHLTATEIAEEIDFLGAQLSTGAGGTGSTISLALLAKDSERGLALLADLLQQPKFDSAELEREQAQMLSEIHQRRVDPHQVVFETFRALFFAGHPLEHPVSGYPETVSRLTRDDVLAFHRRYYVPANTIVVMVGDLSEAQMRQWLERYLGGWQATTAAPVALPQPKALQEKQVRMVDLEVNQSYLQFGLRGVRRADPEFVTLRALNYILGGGGFVSRLMRVIREEQGLAYSVASEVVGLSDIPGYLTAALETRIETTSQALTSMFAVLDRLKREPVTAEELADMQQYFVGSLPHRAETYGQVAGLLLDREFYGLPDGYWATEIEQIQT
ncbi:MAG: M16 family metallopeptidase, partial [Candidatus Entotheonellia bacterium]